MKKYMLFIIPALLLIAADTLPVKNAQDEVMLKLPSGFTSVQVIAELGKNRHILLNKNGDVYVRQAKLLNGKGTVMLRDTNGDGKLEIAASFGDFTGTGIALKNGYLYTASDDDVYRYKLNEKEEVINPDQPEKVVTGLVNKRQHASKSLAADNAGNIYVTIGAPSNACQVQDRTKGSPGQDPCPILETAGGIWQFKADKLNQSYPEGTRYTTGIRNPVALDWNSAVNELYALQHGRDQLNQLYGDMYTESQSAELPSEEFFMAKKGGNLGWPYCYYDHIQNKKILGPEYGGDTKKQERCAGVDQPIVAFPGHWAPNAVLFYTGNQFPAKYKNGAFIAFHGSWNRAPLEQQGYKVVFVPFKNGKPSGNYEVFAEGFKGAASINAPGEAKHRPCGLAQGPDGSLYISDSVKGAIWKISYKK